ncbi:MAG: (dimethylallyl)adenosine tRNA methylthiotransferase, partial [uncultured bacterium]
MKKKIFVQSYGCQMNEYDSAKIIDIMSHSCDFDSTDKAEEADLIVLNTCSIRAKAEEKIFSALGRLRKLKKKKPEVIFAVGGCVAVQEKKNIFRRAPY